MQLELSLFSRLLLILLSFCVLGSANDPDTLYLSWTQDPAHRIGIQWVSSQGTPLNIEFQKEGEEPLWSQAQSKSALLSGSNSYVHQITLSDLEADTFYRFRFSPTGRHYRCRTLPAELDRPVRFVIGGDVYHQENLYRKMCKVVARLNPDFVVLGGDLAYTEGTTRMLKSEQWRVDRWRAFFRIWKKRMVARDGRLIPLIAVVGNHDVKRHKDPLKEPLHFYQLFSFPQAGRAYRTFKVSNQLSLLLLDTDHTYPIAGKQTEWLQAALKEEAQTPYCFPIYHVAAYPSALDDEDARSADVRKHWAPLFEKEGIRVVFENHNHTYKRTYPLRQGKIDSNGVVYLGDGSWGTRPRPTQKHDYLEKAVSTNAVWLVTIDQKEALFESYNISGKKIESFKMPNRVKNLTIAQEVGLSGQ